jgi:hypothetical protein
MKTTKIITNLATLNLVLFISLASTANSNNHSGDNEITTLKNKVSVAKSTSLEVVSPADSENVFSYLRFDVNKYVGGSEISATTSFTLDNLRFDVNRFVGLNETELTEMPSISDFEYLRFDVNEYQVCNSVDELPLNELDYLRFDVNRFSALSTIETDELPAS